MAFDIETVHQSTQRVLKFLRRNRRNPGGKTVHDLRTSVRRLESVFLTLEPKRKNKALIRDLKTVNKRAGRVRDMDVLTAAATTVNPGPDRDCLVQLLEYLGSERSRFASRLHREIEDIEPGLSRRLRRGVKRLDRSLEATASHPPDSQAVERVVAKFLELSRELQRPSHLTRRTLHPYRLKVKELRNVLELAGAADRRLSVKLKQVKDAIGDWHDWEELREIAADMVRHSGSCHLLADLRKGCRVRFDKAIALANELRLKELKPEVRNGRRLKHLLMSVSG